MKTLKIRLLSIAAASAMCAASGGQSLAFPSLPGVPSVPDVKQAAKGALSNELIKEFGSWFNVNRPVYVSGNDVLRTVAALPGGPFHPASRAATRALFTHRSSGTIQIPPGDYNISVVTYCMGHHNQGPWRDKFLLAPIRGAWSDIVVALNYRAYGSRFSAPQIQTLSWALQAGMNYGEMSSTTRQIVDQLLPEFKSRLQGDFYERARDEWNAIASKVPGAPGFDGALNQLGDVGKSLQTLRQARDQIIANANDFNALVGQLTTVGNGRPPSPMAVTPWSILTPGIYARLRTRGTLLTPGVVQLRVTAQAASRSLQVASTHLRGLGAADGSAKTVAFWPNFPFTNWAGFLNPFTQPLSWTPQPDNAPDPNQSDGGPDNSPGGGWQPSGNGWQPTNGGSSGANGSNNGGNNGGNSGNNGANNGGNSGNNNGGDSSNGGGNSGNGNVATNANPNAETDDNGDASTPCDPPGNVFGAQKGQLVSASSISLTLGRGSGQGVVCLLLRPFINLPALGWPNRFNGAVDYGSVGSNLPGHTGSGHLVIYARYTYSTAGYRQTQLQLKPFTPHVTAVIDYSGVTSFCPELLQTISHVNPLTPNWLSGASLENRLCITGMLAQQIQVHAWVVDGEYVNSTSLTHPVDPQNFLYSDYWGHM